ncbi:hypothetical protein [Nocardioides antri]|uniref:Uncharacterized protein n=1 Tax=Nocardioides antri TaxID=2607659 RepID=A0A5B1M7R2_9ACTN|nr:hypothetical protein [Nocardioides antri]KAA1428833.1 hypothetical protein F0U47_01025 [Nocardioides antri]
MTDDDVIDYGAWGVEFFHRAVTEERVLRGVNVLSGRRIDVGPMGVGPGRLVKVTATGQIGTATGHRISDEPVALQVTLPVPLEFTIDLGMDKQRFRADIDVPLLITVHAREDLAIVLDITPPTASQVKVQLEGEGLRAQVLKVAAGVEGELRRFVAKYVAKELTKPYVKDATLIDVSAAIERASRGMGPKDDRSVGDEVTQDFEPALEDEIREHADLFVPEEPPA